jgi:hypothetical protein
MNNPPTALHITIIPYIRGTANGIFFRVFRCFWWISDDAFLNEPRRGIWGLSFAQIDSEIRNCPRKRDLIWASGLEKSSDCFQVSD